MGIPERKEREKLARRNLIIDAAESLLMQKGLASMTVDEIAEQAELSKPTLYAYFKNKHEIHTAIMVRALEKVSRIYEAAGANTETGLDEIKLMLKGLFSLVKENPICLRAFLEYSEEPTPLSEQRERKVTKDFYKVIEYNFSLLGKAVDRGKNDGSCRVSLDTRKTVLIIDASVFGMIKFVADPSRKEELETKLHSGEKELVDYFYSFVEKALSPSS